MEAKVVQNDKHMKQIRVIKLSPLLHAEAQNKAKGFGGKRGVVVPIDARDAVSLTKATPKIKSTNQKFLTCLHFPRLCRWREYSWWLFGTPSQGVLNEPGVHDHETRGGGTFVWRKLFLILLYF